MGGSPKLINCILSPQEARAWMRKSRSSTPALTSCRIHRRGFIPYFLTSSRKSLRKSPENGKTLLWQDKYLLYPHKVLLMNTGIHTGPHTHTHPLTLPGSRSCWEPLQKNPRYTAVQSAQSRANLLHVCPGLRWKHSEIGHFETPLWLNPNTFISFPRKLTCTLHCQRHPRLQEFSWEAFRKVHANISGGMQKEGKAVEEIQPGEFFSSEILENRKLNYQLSKMFEIYWCSSPYRKFMTFFVFSK